MRNIGSAPLILLIIAFIVTIGIAVTPIPHFLPETGWYPGPSIVQKILGAKDPGLSAEKVLTDFTKANIESPYKLTCQTDLDCKTYKILNQCQIYCGNISSENDSVSESLSKNRVCDPASWIPSKLDCRCILGSCLNINN